MGQNFGTQQNSLAAETGKHYFALHDASTSSARLYRPAARDFAKKSYFDTASGALIHSGVFNSPSG
jgi:hypothetical protein